MRRCLIVCAIPVLVLLQAAFAADKSHPRSLDPALTIELFAEQPTIVTPTGIDVDYKGRVFAVESNTHFRPKNYKGHPSDRVLVLQDTNDDGKADKTTVFTDGLTYTMSVKVKPLWLEVRSQKQKRTTKERQPNPKSAIRNPQSVYVATRRDIWLYHDTNGDLKADKRERIIRLETKGNYPHNGLAGIAFDAMGWMYFGFGENLGADYTISGSDGTKLSGGGEGGNVYRCRPDGSKLSRWATGFWNPHASCVDAFGRLFTVDNDPDSRPPCRLLHVIEGGDYGFRFRNGRKGLHPFTAWNGEIPGTLPMVSGTGEAPSGIVAYESDGLPKKYIGNLLVGSWGDHRIDRFVLQPKGASFVSRAVPIIQGGEDFRPVGLAVAPDGSLFCTDWVKRDYNLHGHGRVWRISRKQKGERRGVSPPRKPVIDLSTITPKRPVKELTALLSHPRLEVRRMAMLTLFEIGSKEAEQGLRRVVKSPNCSIRTKIEFFDAFFKNKQVFPDEAFGEKISVKIYPYYVDIMARSIDRSSGLENRHGLGAVTIRFLTSFDPVLQQGGQSWRSDSKTALSTLGWIRGFRHIEPKRFHGYDKGFRQYLTACIEKSDDFHFIAFVRETFRRDSALVKSGFWKKQLKTLLADKVSSPRIRLFAVIALNRKSSRDFSIVRLALKDPSPDVRRVAVQWVTEEHLKELKPQVQAVLNGKVMNADLFLATLAALEMLDGKRPQDFDKTPAGKYVLPLVKDPNRPAAVRAVALRLVDPDEPSLSEKLFKQMLAAKDAKLKTEAVRTLQQSQRSFAGKLIATVALDKSAPPKLRADAISGLTGRSIDDPATLRSLVRLASSREPSIRVEAVRAFRVHLIKTAAGRPVRVRLVREIGDALKRDPKALQKDDSLRRTAETLAAGYRAAQIALPVELQGVVKLRPKTLAGWYGAAKPQAGDVDAGRRVFFAANGASCYRCHTVNGRGGKIGPDLSTIARTANRRRLAESILEPSKEIAPQFTLWSFLMEDGKTYHGIILGDTRNGKRQRIGTADGRTVDLPLNQIEFRRPQSKSVMPEKLIDRLTATEFRDLLAFLESLK